VIATASPSKPRPLASTLQRFAPLLPAELLVLHAALVGDIAKIGFRRPRGPTPEVRVRAEFIAFLARGGSAGALVAGGQLQIVGACIVGCIDLERAKIPMSVWLYRCLLDTAPVFSDAHIAGSLSLPDCALPGLHAQACRIDGDLALNAGCSIDGEVLLNHAVIGRDLNCGRMHLRSNGPAVPALRRLLSAGSTRIRGDVLLGEGFEAIGELRFVAARIGGSVRARNARLTADLDESGARGVALNLDRVQVGGDVQLDAGFSAAGQVRLQRARIGGDLDCSGATFDAAGDASWDENSAALLLDRARIGGALVLRRLPDPLQGASLADARVGSLLDDAQTWGQHHVLDGFAYTRLAVDAPTDAPMRLGWLARQAASHVGDDYRPEPWHRLIKVLRRMGREPSASDVAIGRERHLRRTGRVGLGAPAPLRWIARLGHDLFGVFAGYGHRPLRLLASVAALWLLCGALYWAAAEHGAVAPGAARLLADPRLAHCRTECANLPVTLPSFKPFVYSIELLLPLVDLQQGRHWAPARNVLAVDIERAIGVPVLMTLMWFEAACGWLACLTLFASVTGLIDRDRAR
jgi:hypothetical protein